MQKESRDYRAEYARRIARAEIKGLSRSQARGHAKASEAPLRGGKISLSDERVQLALATLRRERNFALAARSAKVAPERLRKFALEKGLIEKARGRWSVTSSLPRRMPLFSEGRSLTITVGSAETASEVGRYMAAVGRFLETNRISVLEPFAGQKVWDRAGKLHPFETRPNTLYRIASGGEASFEQIYRILF